MPSNISAQVPRRICLAHRFGAAALWLVILLIPAVVDAQAAETITGIDASEYPALTDEELGHLRRMVNLSRQLPGDWSGMSDDLWSVAERTQQFQLSYMAMALALAPSGTSPKLAGVSSSPTLFAFP